MEGRWLEAPRGPDGLRHPLKNKIFLRIVNLNICQIISKVGEILKILMIIF